MEPSHNPNENVEITSTAKLPEGNEKALLSAAQLTHKAFTDLLDCADP